MFTFDDQLAWWTMFALLPASVLIAKWHWRRSENNLVDSPGTFKTVYPPHEARFPPLRAVDAKVSLGQRPSPGSAPVQTRAARRYLFSIEGMAWLDNRLRRQAYLMGQKALSAEDAAVYNALSVHALGEKILRLNMDKHVNISRWYKEMHAAARGDTDSWPAMVRRGMSGSASVLFDLTIDHAQCDELKTDWAQGYVRYASYLFRQERLADAMLGYETGMELDPSSNSARQGLEKCIEVTLYQIFQHGDWLKSKNKGGNEVSYIEIAKNTLRHTGLSLLFSARNRLRRFGTTFARLEEFLSRVETKETSSDTSLYHFPGLDETTWSVVVGRLVGPKRALDPSFGVSRHNFCNSSGEPYDVVLPIEEVELKYIPGPKTRHGIRVPRGKPSRSARKRISPAVSPVLSDRPLRPSYDVRTNLTPDDKHRLLVTQQKAREQHCFRQIECEVKRQIDDGQLKQSSQERGEMGKESSLSSVLDTILKQRVELRQVKKPSAEMLLQEQKDKEEEVKGHIDQCWRVLEEEAAEQKKREEEKAEQQRKDAKKAAEAKEAAEREAERNRQEQARIKRDQKAEKDRLARDQKALDQETEMAKDKMDIDWKTLAENFDQARQSLGDYEKRKTDVNGKNNGKRIRILVDRQKFIDCQKDYHAQFRPKLGESINELRKMINDRPADKEKCCVLIVLKVISQVASLCDSVNDIKTGFERLMIYAQLLSELAADEKMIGDHLLGCLASEKEFENNYLGHSFPWLFLDGRINKKMINDKIKDTTVDAAEKLKKGIIRNAFLFAAFMQANPNSADKRHYRGISNVWIYISNLISRRDKQSYHIFGVKYAVLIAGHALHREYGPQFEKLMTLIRDGYLDLGKTTFETFLESFIPLEEIDERGIRRGIAQDCRDMLKQIFFDNPQRPGILKLHDDDHQLYLTNAKDDKVFTTIERREYFCYHIKLRPIEDMEERFLSFGSRPYAHFDRWP